MYLQIIEYFDQALVLQRSQHLSCGLSHTFGISYVFALKGHMVGRYLRSTCIRIESDASADKASLNPRSPQEDAWTDDTSIAAIQE